MKKQIAFLIIALFALNFTVAAQQNQGQRVQQTPAERAQQMANSLGLNAEQQKQVQELFVQQQKEMSDMRAQAQGNQEDRRARITEMREKWDNDLEKIIGKEKMEQHKAARSQREAGTRQRPNQQ